MISLSSAWKNASEQGLIQCQTPEDGRMLRVANQSALVLAFVMVLGAGIAYRLDFPLLCIIILLGFMLLFSSVLLINRYFHYQWALAAVFVFSGMFVFWEASTFGYESHTHYGFVLLLLGVVLNLYSYRTQLYGSLIGLFILITVMYLTDFSLFAFQGISLELKLQLDQIEFFLLLLTIGLLGLVYASNHRALVEDLKTTRSTLEINNQALQKINDELDQFVYSVSHDLRSPIASMMGLVDLSQQEEDIAVIKEYLILKEKSLHRLDLFIRELLDFSRNSRLDLQYDDIKFQQLLEEMLEACSYSERATKMDMLVDVQQPYAFVTDQRRLRMILHNLLSNAIRYSNLDQEHPYLKIIVRVLERGVTVKVQDNGVGIQKKYITKIFDMFFRARDNDVGSGLGLYIAQEAAQKLGGYIQVQSELGEGTTFTVTLPFLSKTFPQKPLSGPSYEGIRKEMERTSAQKATSSR